MERIKTCIQALRGRLSGGEKESLPQLLMRYPHQIAPLTGKLAKGYILRTYQKGDEESWVELLNANGQLGTWDRMRVEEQLHGDLVEGNQFFVVAANQIVALASVYDRKLEEVACWEIGWVASHPQHRGKGLGRHITAAAVEAALSLSVRPVVLRTDDFRIPAIKVYLKLGFVPDCNHASYPKRWQTIFADLGDGYASFDPGA